MEKISNLSSSMSMVTFRVLFIVDTGAKTYDISSLLYAGFFWQYLYLPQLFENLKSHINKKI